MTIKSEPVKHTCPDIDRIIKTIESIVKQMDNSETYDSTKEELLENIYDWQYELKSIAIGKRSDLEDLRSANASLREWGQELYDIASNLKDKNSELEETISNLEVDIIDLKNEKITLERELNEM